VSTAAGGRVRDALGHNVYMQYVVAPYGPPGGPPVGLVMSAVDLSGEVRAELASNRSAPLARITERVNLAPDPDAALQALTDVLVPEFADLAAVCVDISAILVRRQEPASGAPDPASVADRLTLPAQGVSRPGGRRRGPPRAARSRRR